MAEQEITMNQLAELVKANTSSIDKLVKQTEANTSSIEELARMVKEGFDSVGKQIGELQSDVGTLKSDMSILKSDVAKGFEKVGERLDRVELLAFGDYKRRIEKLEDQVHELMAAH